MAWLCQCGLGVGDGCGAGLGLGTLAFCGWESNVVKGLGASMKLRAAQDVPLQEVTMEGAERVQVRWLVSKTDGAPTFAMRQFELQPGGYTPHHHHPYEHEIYVLEGTGVILDGEEPRPLKAGDVVLVEPDDVHQFRNTGSTVMKMLCLIPNSADSRPGGVRPECSPLDAGREG